MVLSCRYYVYKCFNVSDAIYNGSDFLIKNYTSFSPASAMDLALNGQVMTAVSSVAALYAPAWNKTFSDVADMALRKIISVCGKNHLLVGRVNKQATN